MISILVYLAGLIWLIYNGWTIKKSEEELQPIVIGYLMFFFVMGVQAFFALLFNIVHVPIVLYSLGIADLAVGFVLFYFKKKVGSQKYERISLADIISLIALTVTTVGGCIYLWSPDLVMAFYSVDGEHVHRMLAEFLCENGYYENPQVYEALNDAILMHIVTVFMPGDDGITRGHMLCQILIFWLTSYGFYCFCKTYAQNRICDYLAIILNVAYTFGYPYYAMNFGFAYFVTIINMIAAIFILYRLMHLLLSVHIQYI